MRSTPLKPGKGFRPRSEYAPLARTPFVRKKASKKKPGNYTGGQFSSLTRSPRRALGTKKPEPGSRTLNKIGKKGRENARALRAFKKECARLGIERCEVRYEGCTGEPTTWAHGRRRRFLKEGELETFAVAACVPCHRKLDEGMSHAKCAGEVTRIIGLRPERYLEAA